MGSGLARSHSEGTGAKLICASDTVDLIKEHKNPAVAIGALSCR